MAATTDAPVQVADATVVVEDTIDFESISTAITNIVVFAKQLQGDLKKVQRQYAKLLKSKKSKKSRGGAQNGAAKPPSGFQKPTGVSEELAAFLSLDKDIKIPRTEVTRNLTKYIKDNNLQKPEDKRIIVPDAKLGKLLGTTDSDVVSFFNLQGYLKKHFVKVE